MDHIRLGIYAALALIGSYYIVSNLVLAIRRAQFKKAHGCLPETKYPQSERILGLGFFLERIKRAKDNTGLQAVLQRFQATGNTYSVSLMGQKVFSTREPENIKAVLSTQFEDFSLGSRLVQWAPFAGSGIFTTDGAHWQVSKDS